MSRQVLMQFALVSFNVTHTKSELGAIATSQKRNSGRLQPKSFYPPKPLAVNPWLVAIAPSSDFVRGFVESSAPSEVLLPLKPRCE